MRSFNPDKVSILYDVPGETPVKLGFVPRPTGEIVPYVVGYPSGSIVACGWPQQWRRETFGVSASNITFDNETMMEVEITDHQDATMSIDNYSSSTDDAGEQTTMVMSSAIWNMVLDDLLAAQDVSTCSQKKLQRWLLRRYHQLNSSQDPVQPADRVVPLQDTLLAPRDN